jgi:hypothetical protein
MRRTSPVSVLLVGVVVLAAGCKGKSPTEPGGGGGGGGTPGLVVAFDDPGNQLAAISGAILGHLEVAFAQAEPRIPIAGTTAIVTIDPAREIPGWGLGGYAHGPSRIEIVVSPGISVADLAARLPSIVAHELHHAARFRGPGYGATLLESMVSEGLADHFARELIGAPLPPWVTALTPAEVSAWLDEARPELDSTAFDFEAWFFGTGGEIPRWTGYTLGYRLVGDYLGTNPGATAASLVHVDAGALRPD